MKKMLVLAAVILFAGSAVHAALTEKDLTPAAIQKTITATPAANRQAVAKQIIEAISAQPMEADAKVQTLLSASRALLQGGGSIAIIAELFNTIPVEYLQSVAELLARENFGQAANGMTDAQFDAFCSKVVSSASQYIEVSGTDSPTVRVSILVATFTSASSDPERTRPQLIAALPTAMQAAATTFVLASEQGNREDLAAAAGVDEVAAETTDPDTDKIAGPTVTAKDEANPAAQTEPAMEAEKDYLEPTPPPSSSDAAAAAEETPDVKVPLLSRFSHDVLGIALDTNLTSIYAWDANAPVPPTVNFEAVPELVPGEMFPAGQMAVTPYPDWEEEYIPSPGYGNQEP